MSNLNNDIDSEKNQIQLQMIQFQRSNIKHIYKLSYNDINRIISNIDLSPFGNECCLWNGYIINNNGNKYINFYFKHRKIALHRLLFINYVSDLDDDSYLKFKCKNKGSCCNINHIEKCNPIKTSIKSSINNVIINKGNEKVIQVVKLDSNNPDKDITKKNKLIIVFD